MTITGIGNNYNSNRIDLNHMQKKTSIKDINPNMKKQSVNLFISDEGQEYYRNSIQKKGYENYDTVLWQNEQLKEISINDYSLELQKKAVANSQGNVLSTTDKANGYVKAYAELYDEIVQGYENGIREIYVSDEQGTHKLTKDEELSALDAAYKKTVDNFVTMEKTNQHARKIISKEMEKNSKISPKAAVASAYLEEQKIRGVDEVSENLNEKMYNMAALFKEKYKMFNPNGDKLSQLLLHIKIS